MPVRELEATGAAAPASVVRPLHAVDIPRATVRGPRSSARVWRTSSAGDVERTKTAFARRSAVDGSRSGRQARGSSGSTSGEASSTSASRSVPAMPSTMQWWVLETRAQWSSSRPSMSHISHSGLLRSSRCAMTRPTTRESSSGPPGRGSAVSRRWYSMEKWGSSTHTGRSRASGTKRTRWR